MKTATRFNMLLALVIALLGFAASSQAQETTNLVINEIMSNPLGSDEGVEWIEIHNARMVAQNINGWTISGRMGTLVAVLPDWVFPGSAYLVVHFGTGIDDNDFSDGQGHYFTGGSGEVFNNAEDEIALYQGPAGVSTIVDFVAYCFDGEYSPSVAHDYAVSGGIWTGGEHFGAFPDQAALRNQFGVEGESMGRDKDATDTDRPEDWDAIGGEDAVTPTPGEENLHSLAFVPGPPIQKQPIKEWTVMFYGAGDDTNVEKYCFLEVDEMERVGSDENINLVFQFDGLDKAHEAAISRGGQKLPVAGTYGKTFRGYLKKEPVPDPTSVYLYPTADDKCLRGELNTGQPKNLTDFVSWSVTNFPARRYVLIIYGHGYGWKGVAPDETSDDDHLYIGELDTVLHSIPHLSILGFEACLMAMIEVGYQAYGHANILVASEEVMRADGWRYDVILTHLQTRPLMSDAELATQMVADFHAVFKGVDPKHTLSAVDLNDAFLELVARVNVFADLMLADSSKGQAGLEDYGILFTEHNDTVDNVQMLLKNALLSTHKYKDWNFKDLFDLMEHIQAEAKISEQWKWQAGPIMTALAKGAGVVIAEEHGSSQARSHGLSIYFPRAQTQHLKPFDIPKPSCVTDTTTPLAIYARDRSTEWGRVPDGHPIPETPTFHFTKETRWDEFLHRFYKPVADAGEDQVVTIESGKTEVKVVLDGTGSSDSDEGVTRYIWDVNPTEDKDDEDYDKDGFDEADDDMDCEGKKPEVKLGPGEHIITLTVWDDHDLEPPTPADYHETEEKEVDHSEHWQTDQDTCVVVVEAGESVDLSVGSSSIEQESIRVGEDLDLGFDVRSTGTGEVGGFWVYIFLSGDNIHDLQDYLVGRVYMDGLPPDSVSEPQTTNLTMPESGHPIYSGTGTYYIIIFVDGDSEIIETNESNNFGFLSLRIEVEGPPSQYDLLPSYFNVLETSLFAGGSLNVEYTVQNLGSSDTDVFWVSFYLSVSNTPTPLDFLLGVESVTVLSNSDTGILTATFQLPDSSNLWWFDFALGDATYYIHIKVDSHNEIVETNEGNNRDVVGRFIGGLSIDLSVGSASIEPAVINAGGSGYLTFDVRNTGTGEVGGFWVYIFLSQDTIYDLQDYGLGWVYIEWLPGNSVSEPQTISLTMPESGHSIYFGSGTYYIGIYVDGELVIIEINEGDNISYTTIWIEQAVELFPDLTVGLASIVHESINAGDSLDLIFDVLNTGSGEAGGFWVYIFLSRDTIYSLDDYGFGWVYMDGLPPESLSEPVTTSLSTSDSGDSFWSGSGIYYVGVFLDGGLEIIETNEDNNIDYASLWIEVEGPPG